MIFQKHETNYILRKSPVDLGKYVVLTTGKEKVTVQTIQTGAIRRPTSSYIVHPENINTEDPNGTKIEWYVWEQKPSTLCQCED